MEAGSKPQRVPIYIEDEMRQSFMDYAMSVIISRALPDVRGEQVARRVYTAGARAHLGRKSVNALWRHRMGRVSVDRTGGRPPGGELFSSFDRGAHHFVVLHTRERKDHDVSVGEAQLAWLAADLGENPGPTVVLMHVARAVATRSVGENASPLPLLSVGASVEILDWDGP